MTLIRVIDLECTGLEPTDDVVEIGAVDVAFNTHTKALERLELFGNDLIRPTKPIPPESSAVHHIVDADVKDAKLWDDVWPLYCAPEVGIYAAHNAKFEAQYLSETMRQGAPFICTYKCALRVFPDAPNHKNQTLRYWLKGTIGEIDRSLADRSHRAMPDAYVTAWILTALARKASLDEMIAWSKEPALLPTCPIGDEWRGKKWSEVDEGFLKWMIKKPVDDPDLVWNAKHELSRRWDQQAKDEAERRGTYVAWFKSVISADAPYTVADLEHRFKTERAEQFERHGIAPHSAEYQEIVAACAARKAQLLKEQEHASAA